MTRGRKPRLEGELNKAFEVKYPEASKPSHGPLSDIVAQFKVVHPDIWESIRICPLQHGLETMIEALERA